VRTESAIRLVEQMVYKQGWVFTATDHTRRFEGCICILVEYPAVDSGREAAADGYSMQHSIPIARASFPIQVEAMDDVALYRAIIGIILKIEEHEAREFLRIQPTLWAPFHPHQRDGMLLWGHPQEDLLFGVS